MLRHVRLTAAILSSATRCCCLLLSTFLRALLLRPLPSRFAPGRLQRFACALLLVVMISNTALAGPEVARAVVGTAAVLAHEQWQELGFRWHASGLAARWNRLPFAQAGKPNPQGWDGKGAPKMPPLKELPPETQEERNRRVVSVRIFPESVSVQAGAPVVLQAVGFDATGSPVSGVAFDWSGEDTDKKQSLPVQDSIVTHEAASSSSRGAKVSLPTDASAVVSRRGEFAARRAGHYRVTAEIGGHRAETPIQILDDLKEDAANVQTGAPVSSSDQPVVKAPAGNKTSQAVPRRSHQSGSSGMRRAEAARVSSLLHKGVSEASVRAGLRAAPGGLTTGGNLFSNHSRSGAAAAVFQSGSPANPDGWNIGNYTTADDPGRETGQIPGHAPVTGNTNFQFAAPLLGLDGRGIDLSLTLACNSRIWHKAHNSYTGQDEITLNIDQDWPAPGWSLGFGKLINMGNDERTGSGGGFMLVEPDGTRHPYRGTPSVPLYQQNWTSYPCINCDPNQVLRLDYNGFTTDGTLINYNVTWQRRNPYYGCQSGPGNCVASYSDQPAPYATAQLPNGTIITYGAAPWYMHNAAREYYDGLYPTQITDASGNYITISYVNGQGPKINLVTDTLGRVIQFHYDAAGLLTAITAPAYDSSHQTAPNDRRVIARFQWADVGVNGPVGNYGFSSGLVVRGTSAIVNSTLRVLKAIYYPATQTGYWFGDADSYSTYGILMKVLEMRGLSSTLGGITDSLTTQPVISGGAMSLSLSYNYQTGAQALGSEPSFTQMTEDWAANDTGSPAVTTYNVSETSTERTVEITRPDGLMSRQITSSDVTSDLYGMIKRDETRDGSTLLQQSEVIWDNPANWKTSANYWSPRPLRTIVTDERGQVTATDYFYGARHNQVTETRDYDYGGTTLLRRTVTQYLNDLTTNYDAPHIFRLVSAVDVYDGNGGQAARTEYGYDESALQALGGAAATNHSSPASTYRGHLTTIRRYADAGQASPSSAVTETRTYDICGNVVTAATSCCEQTKFTFTSNTQYCWPETATRGSATNAAQQNRTTAVYDLYTGLVNSSRDADHQNTSTTSAFIISYDPVTLRPVTEQMPTGGYAYHIYGDAGLAVYDFVYRSGDSGAGWASRTDKYLDGAGRVHGEQAWTTDSQGIYVPDSVVTKFDKMGRLWQQTRPYRTSGTEQWTTYAYDRLDRPVSVTAPDGSVTQRFYNEAAYPGVATQGAPGQTVRVKDPWNRERWARFDALNRMVEVVEPNENNNAVAADGYLTKYDYNILGNLKTVTQGDQVREFDYDTLGRLTRQKLAERDATLSDSGVFIATWSQALKKITSSNTARWSDVFAYDDRSNLIQRTDARGVRTIFTYNNDPLNRLQSVSYDTSGVPSALTNTWPIANDYNNVSYVYETGTDRDKTRLLSSNVQYGMGSEQFAYDNEGRLQTRTQTITGKTSAPFVFDYTYDSLNRVAMLKYPAQWNSGTAARKIVEPTYDIASRLDTLKYDGTTFVSNIQYNPASQTTSLTLPLGNGSQVTESYAYEEPTGLLASQQVMIGATTRVNLGYTYADAAGKRTGQLLKVSDSYNASRSRAFVYDSLARLAQVKGGSDPVNNPQWTQTYAYDRYGNRTSVTKSGPQHTNVPLDAAVPNTTTSITSFALNYQEAGLTKTNRITSASYEYDPAGNLMRGQGADGNFQRYTYNAANRMVKVTTDANGYQAEYIYGGNNHRSVFVYDEFDFTAHCWLFADH